MYITVLDALRTGMSRLSDSSKDWHRGQEILMSLWFWWHFRVKPIQETKSVPAIQCPSDTQGHHIPQSNSTPKKREECVQQSIIIRCNQGNGISPQATYVQKCCVRPFLRSRRDVWKQHFSTPVSDYAYARSCSVLETGASSIRAVILSLCGFRWFLFSHPWWLYQIRISLTNIRPLTVINL